MNLIEIKEYKSTENKVIYINPNQIVLIRESDFSSNTWNISFVNGDRMTVDQQNLNIIIDSTKSIINSIFH
jgi:hypothetical protein